MASNGLRIAIQVVLGLIIIALSYWLYVSITAPWRDIEEQRALTELTRERMDLVRATLIQYERQQDRFPSSLDSLVIWARQDSFIQARQDSLFGPAFVLDSLRTSPRTGEPFVYSVNDTGRVSIYLLKDPDTDDQIGSDQPDVTLINAATWE